MGKAEDVLLELSVLPGQSKRAEKKIRRRKMHVTLDAFNHVLFGEESRQSAAGKGIGISSKVIEKQALDTLKGVMQIMNTNANPYSTDHYGAEA